MDSAFMRHLDDLRPEDARKMSKLFGIDRDPAVKPLLDNMRSNELAILKVILSQVNDFRNRVRQHGPRSVLLLCPRCGKPATRTLRAKG